MPSAYALGTRVREQQPDGSWLTVMETETLGEAHAAVKALAAGLGLTEAQEAVKEVRARAERHAQGERS